MIERAEIHPPVEDNLSDVRGTEQGKYGLEASERELEHVNDIGSGVSCHAAEEDERQPATGNPEVVPLAVEDESSGAFESNARSLALFSGITNDRSLPVLNIMDHHRVYRVARGG